MDEYSKENIMSQDELDTDEPSTFKSYQRDYESIGQSSGRTFEWIRQEARERKKKKAQKKVKTKRRKGRKKQNKTKTRRSATTKKNKNRKRKLSSDDMDAVSKRVGSLSVQPPNPAPPPKKQKLNDSSAQTSMFHRKPSSKSQSQTFNV